jgi:hypothetical protein
MASDGKHSFFATLPGLLTGLAALIAALTTVYVTYRQHAAPSPTDVPLTGSLQQPEATGGLSTPRSELSKRQPPSRSVLQEREAVQELASRWLDADRSNDIETLVRISGTPFYFHNQIVLTVSDLRADYRITHSAIDTPYKVVSMKPYTIGEVKKTHTDASRDRFANSILLADSDWLVQVGMRTNSEPVDNLVLFIRYIEGVPRIVGWWVPPRQGV